MFSKLFKSGTELLEIVRSNGIRLKQSSGGKHDWDASSYDKLMDAVGSAKVVMIGEASHGTFDFYKQRAEITKRLITEKGFSVVSVEADWPDAYKINRYIHGDDGDDVRNALTEFKRFPRWMWRNEVMLEFVEWARKYNDQMKEESKKISFYGIDLYSMFESAGEVISHLESVDPELAEEAKKRYGCFEKYGSTQRYSFVAGSKMASCEAGVVKQLVEMVNRYKTIMNKKRKDGAADLDEEFYAKMNAFLVKGAESYYRRSFREDTWNIRDQHMTNTLEQILEHRDQVSTKLGSSQSTRAVVWAHNSHLGDASQTDASKNGETNIGELSRRLFKLENTFNIGFTTYDGSVTAADNWDGAAKKMHVNKSLPGSNEEILHNSGLENFYLLFRSNDPKIVIDKTLVSEFQTKRPERFIGVIYRPDTERQSHYYDCKLSTQYDCVIHLDRTKAIHPMDKVQELTSNEPETYPTGL